MAGKKRRSLADIVKSVQEEETVHKKYKEFLEAGDIRSEKPDECMSFAIGKYGFDTVMTVMETAKSVPAVIPERIRLDMCKQVADMPSGVFEEVYLFLRSKCPSLLSSTRKARDLRVLAPPTGHCLEGCKDKHGCPLQLVLNNKPCEVRFFSGHGPCKKLKVCLKCWKCKRSYNFSQFGDKKVGFRFYNDPRDAIEASDVTIIDRDLFELQCSLANHGWVSFEAWAESYNSTFATPYGISLERRLASKTFFWGEVENELRHLGLIPQMFFKTSNFEECLGLLEKRRCNSLYEHPNEECTSECKARGCGKLWAVDGIWKLIFSHCMMYCKNEVQGLEMLNYPDVCTNSPQNGKAFCEDHSKVMADRGHKTTLRDFLKDAGILKKGTPIDIKEDDIEDFFKEGLSLNNVRGVLEERLQDVSAGPRCGSSVIEEQGGKDLLEQETKGIQELLLQCKSKDPGTSLFCNKDTGCKPTMRMKSRGHLFFVRAGGHIDMFTPLYQSESVSQVFLAMVIWMYLLLKSTPSLDFAKIWVAYDNMCNLARLGAAQGPLNLPAPLNTMWLKVNKIIDGLHLKNHKRKDCHKLFDPKRIGEMYSELKETKNTMVAEQTFVWAGRFKKIVAAMPKLHHLFYLHRMVKRRNHYTAFCYRTGLKPLLPTIHRLPYQK